MANSSDLKRKAAEPQSNHRAAKKAKFADARTILSQPRDKALNMKGDLDTAAFVKAREFEINAMEKGMQKSKKALTTRAFQEVPRNMRRRTASHNVKKVPKRLQMRAIREVRSLWLDVLARDQTNHQSRGM